MENNFFFFPHPGLLSVLLLVISVDCQRTLPEGSVLTRVCVSSMFAQKLFIDLPSVAHNMAHKSAPCVHFESVLIEKVD